MITIAGFLFFLAGTVSCERKGNHFSHYGYRLTVSEISPMRGVQTSLAVKKRWTHETPKAYAELISYTRYNQIKANQSAVSRVETIPLDTTKFSLSRVQFDSLYFLAGQAFTVPVQPAMNYDSIPLPPSSHDLDNYLAVDFRPYENTGPTLKCIGYKEYNQSTYTLYAYLMRLKAVLPAKRF